MTKEDGGRRGTMSDFTSTSPARRKQTSPLMYFLIFAAGLFIGILIFVYMVTKKAHPLYTDEHGNVTNAESSDQHGSTPNSSK
jgi:hypothetical protein